MVLLPFGTTTARHDMTDTLDHVLRFTRFNTGLEPFDHRAVGGGGLGGRPTVQTRDVVAAVVAVDVIAVADDDTRWVVQCRRCRRTDTSMIDMCRRRARAGDPGAEMARRGSDG